MVTDLHRENRALLNLERALTGDERKSLSTGQLHCASVDNPTLTRLLDAGAIEVAPLGRYRLTNSGQVLLNSRVACGEYGTIQANP